MNDPEKCKNMINNGIQAVSDIFCWHNEKVKLLQFVKDIQNGAI